MSDPFAAFAPSPATAMSDPTPVPSTLNTVTQNPYANPIDGMTPVAPVNGMGLAPIQGYGANAAQGMGNSAQAGIGGGSGGFGIQHAPIDPAMNAFRRIKPATTGAGSAGMTGAQPINPAEL